MMKTIKITATNIFTPEMERLRRDGYCGKNSDICTKDEFDDKSTHIIATCEDELIGMVRLTMNPVSVLRGWAGNLSPVSDKKGVAELTRAVVAENWSGKDVFKLLIVEAVICAINFNAKQIFAFTEPRLNHYEVFYRIGFERIGQPFVNVYPLMGETLAQTIAQSTQKNLGKVLEERARIVNGENCGNSKSFRRYSMNFRRLRRFRRLLRKRQTLKESQEKLIKKLNRSKYANN